MKPEEINKAIAEALGYYRASAFGIPSIWYQTSPFGDVMIGPELPNFAGSLDAMAEARNTLTKSEQLDYANELQVITKLNDDYDLRERYWWCANATAEQHAEAFLRSKGLWQE